MASLRILREEPLRFEVLGVWEVSWVSVQRVGDNDCLTVFHNFVTRCQGVKMPLTMEQDTHLKNPLSPQLANSYPLHSLHLDYEQIKEQEEKGEGFP